VNAGEDAAARRIALDVIEEDRGRILRLRGDFRERADLEVPVGALDPSKLADLVRPLYPTAQITIKHGDLFRSSATG
jgi:hypothetical protein